MTNLYSRILLRFILTACSIMLIATVPDLFNGMKLDFSAYISSIGSLFSNLLNPDALIFYTPSGRSVELFPNLWGKWGYSMILIFTAFFIAFFVALVCTYLTMLLPKKIRNKVSFILILMESIPDVLIIGIFTTVVLIVYKKTDILFFNIVAYGDERIYVLPAIVLTILPALLFYRIMIHDFENELRKSYIDFARSKGLQNRKLLFSHVLRNAIISIFQHSKSILWFMLSNLLLIEYVFNLSGLLRFMFDYHSPEILAIGLLLIFVPIYIMQAAGQILIEKITNIQMEIG